MATPVSVQDVPWSREPTYADADQHDGLPRGSGLRGISGPENKGKVLTADLEVVKPQDSGIAAVSVAASDGS